MFWTGTCCLQHVSPEEHSCIQQKFWLTPIDQAIYYLFLDDFPLSSHSECYWKAWVLLPLGEDASSCVCRIIWISIWSASKKGTNSSQLGFSALIFVPVGGCTSPEVLAELVWGRSGDARMGEKSGEEGEAEKGQAVRAGEQNVTPGREPWPALAGMALGNCSPWNTPRASVQQH